ncbi:MAG: allantoicase [Proteobacteria bacterium]|nr:allantoicase [Pseudomonadota bacterium]
MNDAPSNLAAFADLLDLSSSAVGAVALLASDDFFAEKENLVLAEPPVFDPDAYTERGKEMDGWESRRQRIPGHDWCIVKLGIPGRIRGVDIDTSFFTGNQPPYGALYGLRVSGPVTAKALRDSTNWVPLTGQVPLRPGSHNLFATTSGEVFTHVRLDIYPDGGVARLRCYGEPVPEASDERIDLAASLHGGRAIAASDRFYSPPDNLLAPGLPKNMGGGWETRRRRTDGNDWVVVALGEPGVLDALVVNTTHYKGNFPDRCRVSGIWWPDAPTTALLASDEWVEVLVESKLRAHEAHMFPHLESRGPFTHLRVDIVPCGGLARFRALGTPGVPDIAADPVLVAVNGEDSEERFFACCGSRAWAKQMAAQRPYQSRAQLLGTAEHVWWHLGEGHWREAFTHHPRIGADVASLRAKFATAELSAKEQGQAMASASEETLRELALKNAEYDERFGHLFIVFATGKSAAEMLELLEQRLDNSAAAEIRIAAGEQAKITRNRLETLA